MLLSIRSIQATLSRLFALLAMGLIACSSGATAVVTPPPPPGTSGTPASLTIVSGDGQSAAPGVALPVQLSVLVQDASGTAIAGVVVAFAVDSGGGSLSVTSATTGTNGVAIAGTWTLGAASGTNVVSARVTTLTPVKFHAQAFGVTARTVFTAAPVSSSGGTLTYSKPGDPLSGLTVTVPARSYPTATQWTITADSSVAVKLPAGFSQVGPALVVSNAQGYADSVLTLTMPMAVAANIAVAPFYFDPATGTLEGIPLVARTATSVTLAARHFSGDLMATPGSGLRSSLRASLRLGFGDVNIVWVQVPAAQLAGTWNSGFQVGVDNWEFINYGDYISPAGDCEGMSITEMYYYYFIASGGRPHLYHHFDVSLANSWDNVQGIRFAGSVQEDYGDATVNQVLQLTNLGSTKGIDPSTLTATWVALTLKLTHQPVLLALYGAAGAHAVVAYAATVTGVETDVSFADPNFPTTLRLMKFSGLSGTLDPVTLQANANASASSFTTAIALGVGAIAPIATIATRYSEFINKQAGQDRYPSQYAIQVFDSVNQVWDSLPDTVRTTINRVKVRVQCPGCPQKLPGANPPDLQSMTVLNDSGTGSVPVSNTQDGITFELYGFPDTRTAFVAVAQGASPFSSPVGKLGFLDSHSFSVIYSPLKLASPGLHGISVTKYTYAASVGALAMPTSQFVWDFGDGTGAQTVAGDTTISHVYAAIGTYRPSVKLLDGAGKLIGADTETATITHIAWLLNTASVTSVLPSGGIGSDPIDTVTQQTVNSALSGLPGALIFRVDSTACSAIVLELGGGPDSGLVSGTHKAVFASSCAGFFGNFSMGTLGSGVVSGDVVHVVPTGALLSESSGQLDAVMSGATLSGTFMWAVPYTGGNGVYTIEFSAIQVEPPPAPSGPEIRARRP